MGREVHKEYIKSFFPRGFEMRSNKHLLTFPIKVTKNGKFYPLK